MERLDEDRRLEALDRYRILDSDHEPIFDHLTELVAEILGVPICLVTLVDRERQWFKSHHGLPLRETPRAWAFCDHAIRREGRSPLIVGDATGDPRFADNPLVKGEPFIRFYAGVPLRSSDGQPLGTLCAIDRMSRTLTAEQLELLGRLAHVVEVEIELRRRLLDVEENYATQSEAIRRRQQLTSMLVHDLRNPATTIALSIGFVQQQVTGVAHEALSDALVATERLHRHLIDVLDICLADTGDLVPLISRTTIAAVLDSLTSATSYQAAERAIEITAHDTGDLEWALDRDLVLRILINLVENAIEHAPESSAVRVGVRTGERLTFTVSDSGPPIFEGVDPFGPGDRPTGRGRGVGLTFCRVAAEVHGGEVSAERTGGGNQFRLEIPPGP